MFYKIEDNRFTGFYEDKDKTGDYTEITLKDWQGVLDKQSEGEVIFYNVKNKKLETIKLNRFETIKNGEIEFDRAVKIEYLKAELSNLKTEYSEKEFIFKEKYYQKNRDLDKNNLTSIVVMLNATNQKVFKEWKFKDEKGNDVYVDLNTLDMINLAKDMQEQTTKSMKIESKLIEKLDKLNEDELKTFDSRKEYEILWN